MGGWFLNDDNIVSFDPSSIGGDIISNMIMMNYQEPNNIITDTNQNENFGKIRMSADIMRGNGSTTWLIKSAIINPDCILVFRDENCRVHANAVFTNIVNTEPMFREIYENNNRREPITTTLRNVNNNIRGHRKPIIYDNSCFF